QDGLEGDEPGTPEVLHPVPLEDQPVGHAVAVGVLGLAQDHRGAAGFDPVAPQRRDGSPPRRGGEVRVEGGAVRLPEGDQAVGADEQLVAPRISLAVEGKVFAPRSTGADASSAYGMIVKASACPCKSRFS